MNLPRCLDRERLLREERVIARTKAKEAGRWFHRCTELRLELAAARVEIARLTEMLAKQERATP